MSTFARCHCETCAPKVEKLGNRTLPLPCRNSGKFQTSICSRQTPNTRFLTKLSMRLNSSVAIVMQPKTTPKLQPKRQTTKVQSNRIDQRVSSPARSFSSFTSGLKTIANSSGKPTLNTPTKCQLKYLSRIPLKLNQSTPTIVPKSTPIMQKKTAKVASLKVVAKNLVPIIDTEHNQNENEAVEKQCDENSNIESYAGPEDTADECVTKDSSGLALLLDEMSIIKNAPTSAEPSILHQENIQIQEQEPSLQCTENKMACKTDHETKIPTAQSKLMEETLNLLNTGTEKQLSNKLTTVGVKTAAQIVRYREIRGKFEKLEDLQTNLGWSNKMYEKFRFKNFL